MKETREAIDIGSLYERGKPLVYCARHLAFHFLLSEDGENPLKSDGMVRVSVKNLALNCLVHVGILEPEIWNLHLSKSANSN